MGQIFWERGGVVVGDHAGHIVYDDTINAFRLLVSNWGTFSGNGVLINAATVREDVLHGVHVIRNPTVQQLPTTVSRWDPRMMRINGVWYIAFVESPSQNLRPLRHLRPEHALPRVPQRPLPDKQHPAPLVFPVADTQTQTTRWRMVTFEGTQYYENILGYGTYGDFLIMDAPQVERGYEFAPRRLPSLG